MRPNNNTDPTGPAAEGEPVIDTGVAHQGRVHDYLAGGDAHFAVDCETANARNR